MTGTKARLTQGPVASGLFRLATPMLLGIACSIGLALIETWFLGRVGTAALAAYSFTFPVIMGISSLTLGLSIGLSSQLARLVGAGDAAGSQRIATHGILLGLLIMVLVCGGCALANDFIFRALGASEQLLDDIRAYMLIWYVGQVSFVVPTLGTAALRAHGDARWSGLLMVGGSAVTLLLDPLFIFGVGPLPAMGLAGAALASLLARWVLLAGAIWLLVFRERLLALSVPTLGELLHSWREVLKIGAPAAATNLVGPISSGLIVSLLAGYGDATVAGFGIAARVESLSVIPLYALSASIGPFVGQNWGAERRDRADYAMRLTFLFSLVWGLLVAGLLALLAPLLVMQFDDNPQVREVATTYLYIVPLSYGAWGILMMASATFNSLGRPLPSTGMSVTRMFLLYVPLAFLLESWFGAAGIFMAAAVANAGMGVVGFIWNRLAWGQGRPLLFGGAAE